MSKSTILSKNNLNGMSPISHKGSSHIYNLAIINCYFDGDYKYLNNSIIKLTSEYIEININIIDNKIPVFDELFKLLENKSKLIITYSNKIGKIISKFYLNGFKITNIKNIFDFDIESYKTPIKIYYTFDEAEYINLNNNELRKRKLNKLINYQYKSNKILKRNILI